MICTKHRTKGRAEYECRKENALKRIQRAIFVYQEAQNEVFVAEKNADKIRPFYLWGERELQKLKEVKDEMQAALLNLSRKRELCEKIIENKKPSQEPIHTIKNELEKAELEGIRKYKKSYEDKELQALYDVNNAYGECTIAQTNVEIIINRGIGLSGPPLVTKD